MRTFQEFQDDMVVEGNIFDISRLIVENDIDPLQAYTFVCNGIVNGLDDPEQIALVEGFGSWLGRMGGKAVAGLHNMLNQGKQAYQQQMANYQQDQQPPPQPGQQADQLPGRPQDPRQAQQDIEGTFQQLQQVLKAWNLGGAFNQQLEALKQSIVKHMKSGAANAPKGQNTMQPQQKKPAAPAAPAAAAPAAAAPAAAAPMPNAGAGNPATS